MKNRFSLVTNLILFVLSGTDEYLATVTIQSIDVPLIEVQSWSSGK